MIELLKSLISQEETDEKKYHRLREYLQQVVLKVLEEQKAFTHIAFVGGTALRILYDLRRFSEDLDFSLIKEENFDCDTCFENMQKALSLQNFNVNIKKQSKKTVASCFIKFSHLLHALNLASMPSQNISIKIEIDRNPPSGFGTTFSVINKDLFLGINHYDLPSLFAGKLHAILYRKHTKGRDFYDLIWFVGKQISPNLVMLNKAIEQTEEKESHIERKDLVEKLQRKIQSVDLKKVTNDLRPFIESPGELNYFTVDKLSSVVEKIA